jgi:hypothetical protein
LYRHEGGIVNTPEPAEHESEAPAAAERIRDLSEESGRRGSPMVSSIAMQTRLFDVYDEVAVSPEALALLQQHLKLTLERTWYRPDEIESLASQIESYLADQEAAGDAGEELPEPV